MTHQRLVLITALLGATAVALGAFGAHGLKEILSADRLAIYQTGITYHFYHTLALLGIAALAKKRLSKWLRWSAWCFVIGIFFFSGSLYLIANKATLSLDAWMFIIGPITPIGGLFFILGWLLLIPYVLKR